MRKKILAILIVLSMGLGLPGAYFQAIVSESYDNYCFAPAYPTPPDLSLWIALFFIGAGLGLIAWLALLEVFLPNTTFC